MCSQHLGLEEAALNSTRRVIHDPLTYVLCGHSSRPPDPRGALTGEAPDSWVQKFQMLNGRHLALNAHFPRRGSIFQSEIARTTLNLLSNMTGLNISKPIKKYMLFGILIRSQTTPIEYALIISVRLVYICRCIINSLLKVLLKMFLLG